MQVSFLDTVGAELDETVVLDVDPAVVDDVVRLHVPGDPEFGFVHHGYTVACDERVSHGDVPLPFEGDHCGALRGPVVGLSGDCGRSGDIHQVRVVIEDLRDLQPGYGATTDGRFDRDLDGVLRTRLDLVLTDHHPEVCDRQDVHPLLISVVLDVDDRSGRRHVDGGVRLGRYHRVDCDGPRVLDGLEPDGSVDDQRTGCLDLHGTGAFGLGLGGVLDDHGGIRSDDEIPADVELSALGIDHAFDLRLSVQFHDGVVDVLHGGILDHEGTLDDRLPVDRELGAGFDVERRARRHVEPPLDGYVRPVEQIPRILHGHDLYLREHGLFGAGLLADDSLAHVALFYHPPGGVDGHVLRDLLDDLHGLGVGGRQGPPDEQVPLGCLESVVC